MYSLVIIGSGPAGLTSAIYTARAQMKPLVVDGREAGGQLMTTTSVENWPGSPDGIDGPQLMSDMRKQAEKFGSSFLAGEVTEVDFSQKPLRLFVGGTQLETQSVIIATGASPRKLGLASEKKLYGRGVSACATCDGFFFKGKNVLVVGGGDTAMEEAVFLSKLASHVTVVHRRETLRAEKIMQDRAFEISNIDFIWNTVIQDIHDPEQGTVTGVSLQNVQTGDTTQKECAGVFLALGHVPNTKLFVGQLDLDKLGFVITRKGTATNIPGVFAAGDVSDPVYKQAVTAAGTGCMAALDAERYLQGI